MVTDGVVGVWSGKGIGMMAGRRMSLRGVATVEEIGSSDDSGRIDAADAWLVSVTDSVCQLTDPPMTHVSPRIQAKTVLFSKLGSAPLSYRFSRVRAFDLFSPRSIRKTGAR